MPEYDGSIRINTNIETKESDRELKRLKSSISKTAEDIDALRSKMNASRTKLPTKDYESLQRTIKKSKFELESLIEEQSKLTSRGFGKSLDKEYLNAYLNVKRLKGELQQSVEARNQDNYIGIEDRLNKAKVVLQDLMSGEPKPLGDIAYYESLKKRIQDLKSIIAATETEMQKLVDNGNAFSVEEMSDENADVYAQIQKLSNKMLEDQRRASEIQSELVGREQRIADIKASATVSDREIISLLERRKELVQIITDMEQAGLGYGYQEYESAQQELSSINQQVQDYKNNLNNIPERFSKMKDSVNKLASVLETVSNIGKKSFSVLRNSASKAFASISSGSKKSSGLLSTFSSRLKGIALSLLIFNWITKAFNAMVAGMKKGFENLMNYSSDYANSVQSLRNAMDTLGNQFAAAFAPIVQMVIPWLTSLISAISTATTYVAQFIAILGGKSTFTRAKQVQDSYNKSLGATASAAKKAYGALAKFDDLDVLQKQENANGGSGAAGDLFEEVPVDSSIKKLVEKLRGILSNLFAPLKKAWEREGQFVMKSWKYALEEIQKLAKDIGRDFLTMWNEEATIQMFADILHIIGDIGLVIGNIAHALDEAWNKNQTGLRILENIRDIFAVIIENIREAADYTVLWSETLDFSTLLKSVERLTSALKPFADFVSGTLSDFYTQFILPLISFSISDQGLPRLANILSDLMERVDWEVLRTALKNLYAALEPYAEAIAEGLIDFIEKIKDFGVDLLNSLPEPIQRLADALASGDPDKVRAWTTTLLEFVVAIEGLKLAFKGFEIVESMLAFFGIGGAGAGVAKGIGEVSAAIGGLSTALGALGALGIIEVAKEPIIDLGEAAGMSAKDADYMRERYKGLSGDLNLVKDTASILTNGIQGLGWEMSNQLGAAGALETAMNNISDGMIYTDDKLSKLQKNFGLTDDDIEMLRQSMLDTHPELREMADSFGLLDASVETLQDIYDGMKLIEEGTISASEAADEFSKPMWNMSDAALDFFQSISEGTTSLGDYQIKLSETSGVMDEFATSMEEAGENIADGVTKGFENADVVSPIQDFHSKLDASFSSEFDMHSPAKRMEPTGENILLGVLEGFRNKFVDFSSAINDLMQSIQVSFSSENTQNIGQELGNGIVHGFQERLQQLCTWISSEFIPMFIGEGLMPWFSFEKWHDEILINIPLAFQTMWEEFLAWWNDEALDIWWNEYVCPWFYEEKWKLQFENILLAFEAIWQEISEFWVNSLDDWWEMDVKPRFTLSKWMEMLKPVDNAYDKTFTEVVDTINSKMKEAYNIVVDWTNQMMSSIQEVMSAIEGISSSMSSMSGMSISVSGASAATYSLDGVPHLASGSVIRGGNPFFALLGDQPHGQTNVEAPLSTIEQAVENVISRRGYGGGISPVISLNVNAQEFARLTLNDILQEMSRQGYDVELLGVN